MGNTYVNVTVVGTTADAVVTALGPSVALVADDGDGCVVVFAEVDEEEALGEGRTASELSAALGVPAFEVFLFDDDLIQYRVFTGGEAVVEGAFPEAIAEAMMMDTGGDDGLPESSPEHLVEALGRGDADAVREVMGRSAVFATELHSALAGALGLPTWAAGWGYRYLEDDPDELPVEVIRTP